jgi:hypothetical protein
MCNILGPDKSIRELIDRMNWYLERLKREKREQYSAVYFLRFYLTFWYYKSKKDIIESDTNICGIGSHFTHLNEEGEDYWQSEQKDIIAFALVFV